MKKNLCLGSGTLFIGSVNDNDSIDNYKIIYTVDNFKLNIDDKQHKSNKKKYENPTITFSMKQWCLDSK